MNTSFGIDTYRSHNLNIAMRTSSGDIIKLDFANENASSLRHSEGKNGSQSSLSFSSMQSFSFSIKSNGINEQDAQEIKAFMKIAQPYIDNFLKELGEDTQKSPITKLARTIAGLFDPDKPRDEDTKNAIKANIVKMFDNAIAAFEPSKIKNPIELMEKIFNETQKLLEKTLQEFNTLNKKIYA